MSACLEVIGNLQRDLSFPLSNLVPPESVSVEAGEAVDDDGDGKGEDEQSSQGTEPANHTTKECLGISLYISMTQMNLEPWDRDRIQQLSWSSGPTRNFPYRSRHSRDDSQHGLSDLNKIISLSN